jgi:cytoskeleton protein RodZ
MGDFGGKLRAAREQKGVSLRQIAAATKISVSSLEALERNDISRLPGGIFTRAFVRSYAIEVGLDPDEIVQEFLTQFASEAPPSAPVARRPPAAPAHGSARTRENVSDETAFESQQRMASVVLKLLIASVPVAIAILYLGTRAPAPVARPSAEPSVPAAAVPGQAAPEPPANATPPRAGEADPEPDAAAEFPSAPPEPAPEMASAAPAVRLELVPTEDCWAQLTVDGEVVLSRVVAAGERASHAFREWAVLQVGDAAACAVTIDGRPMRPLGGPRQVRQVRLTRENYPEFLR